VDFRGGLIGFVRMELGAKILQNALIGNEIWGKYVLQRFKNRTDLRANMPYKGSSSKNETKKNKFIFVTFSWVHR
jgi:hypothetical protein